MYSQHLYFSIVRFQAIIGGDYNIPKPHVYSDEYLGLIRWALAPRPAER